MVGHMTASNCCSGCSLHKCEEECQLCQAPSWLLISRGQCDTRGAPNIPGHSKLVNSFGLCRLRSGAVSTRRQTLMPALLALELVTQQSQFPNSLLMLWLMLQLAWQPVRATVGKLCCILLRSFASHTCIATATSRPHAGSAFSHAVTG